MAGGITLIRAVHIADLREALRQAYLAAGMGSPFYTDPVLGPGAIMRTYHISQLRTAVHTLEEN